MNTRIKSFPLAGLVALLVACGGPSNPPGEPDAGVTEEGPSLVSTVPADGASAVAIASGLSLVFSRPLLAPSLTVTLTPATTLGAPSWSAEGAEVTFAAQLLAGTRYLVTVSASDDAGRALSGTTSFSFETRQAVDDQPPTVVSSTPTPGAVNVAVAQALVLTFSEAMNTESLALVLEPTHPLGPVSWSSDGKVATIDLSQAPLESKTDYLLSISASDLAGNPLVASLGFSTEAPPDTTPPTVSSSSPAAGAAAVPAVAAVSLSFSEPMDKASVDAAFSLTPAVAGTVLWDASGTLRSFQPSAPLAAGQQYAIALAVGARDEAGNALAAPFAASFTVANAPDTTRPTLVSSNPAASENGVDRFAPIILVFSEPMDRASVQVAFSVTSPQGVTGAVSWSADGKELRFAPAAPWAAGESVVWRLNLGARDLAGNTVSSLTSRGFRVMREATIHIDATAALDGYVSSSNTVQAGSGFIIAGDNASNLAHRGFLSFDLSGVPTNAHTLRNARLNVYLSGAQGDPAGTLGGPLRLQRVRYGPTLTAAAYDTATMTETHDDLALAQSTTAGWRSQVVVVGVADDLRNRGANGDRTQFRLRLPSQTSANGQADAFNFYSGNTNMMDCPRATASGASCRPFLSLTYTYP